MARARTHDVERGVLREHRRFEQAYTAAVAGVELRVAQFAREQIECGQRERDDREFLEVACPEAQGHRWILSRERSCLRALASSSSSSSRRACSASKSRRRRSLSFSKTWRSRRAPTYSWRDRSNCARSSRRRASNAK